jgi:hypothetical protein
MIIWRRPHLNMRDGLSIGSRNAQFKFAQFPFSGQILSEYELSEVREVIEGSYRIIFLIDPEAEKGEA